LVPRADRLVIGVGLPPTSACQPTTLAVQVPHAGRASSPAVIDIAANVAQYLGDRSPVERASSFDYCFNYFQRFGDSAATGTLADPAHREASCLQLGYYLASWGMLRGSTALHTKSYRFFEPVIETIAEQPASLWSIDADVYTEENISALIELRDRLATALTARPALDGAVRAPTNTLVTKVMLGVFGSVPAFDTYFVRGFRTVTTRRVTFSRRSLEAVGDFYEQNSAAIDAQRIPTLDAASGQFTRRCYTRAKVIDMVFLIEGGGR
jgi:hypothetical protein